MSEWSPMDDKRKTEKKETDEVSEQSLKLMKESIKRNEELLKELSRY